MPDYRHQRNICLGIVTFLIIFNLYYFFIRKGVDPIHYIEKISSKPSDRVETFPFYQDLANEYKILNQQYGRNPATVFLGDSITKRFNLCEFFEDPSILNRGIFSDTTHGVLLRLEENVNNLNVSKLFLLIGFNDLEFRNNNEIIQNIMKILSKVQARKIFVQSLLPVRIDKKGTNARIMEINSELKKVCGEKGLSYIDLHSKFADIEGRMAKEYSSDGIHPNILGYKIWFKAIAPLVESRKN